MSYSKVPFSRRGTDSALNVGRREQQILTLGLFFTVVWRTSFPQGNGAMPCAHDAASCRQRRQSDPKYFRFQPFGGVSSWGSLPTVRLFCVGHPVLNGGNQSDEFYIGWEGKAAPGISRTLGKTVIALALLAMLAPVALAVSQRLIGASVFEWGTRKSFSGILQARLSMSDRAAPRQVRRTSSLHLLPRSAVEIWFGPRGHCPA